MADPTALVKWADDLIPADDVRVRMMLVSDLALVKTLYSSPEQREDAEAWSALWRLVENHIPALQVAWHTANDQRYDAEHAATLAQEEATEMAEQLDRTYVALAESVGFWVAPPHQLIELPSSDSDRAREIMNVLGARPCYICGTYVLTREEGWWDDKGSAWCHAHQPVWSRP